MGNPTSVNKENLSHIHLLLLTVTIFWGTSYAAAKIGMYELLPLNLAILRFAMAAVLFSFFLLVTKSSSRINLQDIPQFFFLGFLSVTLYFYLQYTGLQYTTSTNAGLIMATSPAFAALFCLLPKKKP